jgi:LPS export ABC transporter protein LptC
VIKNNLYQIIKSSVVLLLATLFFSCTNDIKEVHDFLSDKNLPIGVSVNINTVYKDSGLISTKLKSPLFKDFSNRTEHPYSEFPEGINITKIERNGDSTNVTGKYAISYTKTEIAEIRDEVVVTNYANKYTLYTPQLFWDQKNHFFITEKKFTLITPSDTLKGVGFESTENLTNWHAKDISGSLHVNE